MQSVLLPVAEDPTVTVAFTFAVGSQHDPEGKEGLAALTAEMLVEGATTRLTYEDILDALYPLATDYAATVDKEMTTIEGRVHTDVLADFIELLSDAVLQPAFGKEDFERIRNDAINFIANTLRYSSDEELGKAALTATVFGNTRYAHPVEGTLGGLRSITLDDVNAFYKQHYAQNRLTLGIAGGYPDDLPAKLEQACAGLPAGAPIETPAIEFRPINGRELVLIDKPGADASISLGFPLNVARGERDFYALWLANSWLGEHRHGASRLFQVIRETRGLNYGDYSYIEAFPDGGDLQMPPVNVARKRQLFEAWIRTLPNDQALFALKITLREIDRLIEHGLTDKQFELTRRFLQKYSTHYAPTTADRLGYAIDDAFYGIEPEGHLARFQRIMDELTAAEVNRAIERHWQTDNLVIAIVTGDAAGLYRAIANGAGTSIEYPIQMPATILAEDREIAGYPLGIDAGAIDTIAVTSIFA